MSKKKKKVRLNPILAAGGIVTRGRAKPVFAVVRLSRQKSWVLPKGKLNRDETTIAAARREAIEETGHDMTVREFLGALSYTTSGRPKTVKFWRMEASRKPVAKLMKDVRAVRWLPLAQALKKLTHERERVFLAKVGPHALAQLRRPEKRRPAPAPRPRRKPTVRPRQPQPASAPRPAAPRFVFTRPKQIVQALWRWLGR